MTTIHRSLASARPRANKSFYVPDNTVTLSINSPPGPFTEGTAYPFAASIGILPANVAVTSYVWSALSLNGRTVGSLSGSGSSVPNFIFTPPQGGSHLVKLSVVFSDGRVANATTTPFTVTGLAPTISQLGVVSPNLAAIGEGTEVTVQVAAADGGEPIGLNYAWELQSPGGSFVAIDGVASSPSLLKFMTSNNGLYNVRVTVTDSQGLTAVQTLCNNCQQFASNRSLERRLIDHDDDNFCS